MASVHHLEFEKYRFFFVKFACAEWKFVSVYEIWSKSDNSRLRYGDKAIFKMAAVRRLEFSKISVLVMCPVLACDSVLPIQISRWSVNMAPRYSQKTIFNMASVRHLEFANFDFLLNVHHSNWNVHLPTKFDRNRIILGWDVEIILLSKWRPSAILNLRKLQFWSRYLYRHVIIHLRSKFRVDRLIWRWDIAKKNDFQYGVRPSSWICYDVIILHRKNAFYVPNFVLNFHGVRFRNFWNIFYFMFQHFGLKLPISDLFLTIFGEKRHKCEN